MLIKMERSATTRSLACSSELSLADKVGPRNIERNSSRRKPPEREERRPDPLRAAALVVRASRIIHFAKCPRLVQTL